MPSNAPLGAVSVQVTMAVRAAIFLRSRGRIQRRNLRRKQRRRGTGIVTDFVSAAASPQRPERLGGSWTGGHHLGTGLGAVPSDINPPAAGNLPVKTEVFVGGVSAALAYSGRSPCCSGLDQIVSHSSCETCNRVLFPWWCAPRNHREQRRHHGNSAKAGAACSDAFNPLEQPSSPVNRSGIVAAGLDQTVNVIVDTAVEPFGLRHAGMFRSSANPYFFQPMFSLPAARFLHHLRCRQQFNYHP